MVENVFPVKFIAVDLLACDSLPFRLLSAPTSNNGLMLPEE
jgi:hypothetical protein